MRKDGRLRNPASPGSSLVSLCAYSDPLRYWAHSWASETWGAWWVESQCSVGGVGSHKHRDSWEGERARGAGGVQDSMSQQGMAQRLSSLLMDPAQETVRRCFRDPINVENLLPSKIRINLEENVQYVSMRSKLMPQWVWVSSLGITWLTWLVLRVHGVMRIQVTWQQRIPRCRLKPRLGGRSGVCALLVQWQH